MPKEKILTVMVPIKDSDCEATVYQSVAALQSAVPASDWNKNKIYKIADGTYCRSVIGVGGQYDYDTVTDREFPYLGNPLEKFDFTYDATRMGSAPTISAQGVMRYADEFGNTLDGLWNKSCFVSFNGEKFHLKQIPTSSKSNEDARYRYDLDFVADSVILESVYLYDIVSPFITEKPLSESAAFSFYGDINDLAKRVNASLVRSGLAKPTRKYVPYPSSPSNIVPYLDYEQWNQLGVSLTPLIGTVFTNLNEATAFVATIYHPLRGNYNAYLMEYIYENDNGEYILTGYQCKIGKDKYGNPTTSEEKLITFENNTIHEALQQFPDTFEVEYYITHEKDGNGGFTGNTLIMVADCEHDFADWDEDEQDFVRDEEGIPVSTNPFDYGVADALLSKEKTNTTDKIVTRITGVGSSENIPWYYPNPNPDGWIKPFVTRKGEEMEGVYVDYPIDEGSSVADSTRYERYLKNRIGNAIKRGVAKYLKMENEWIAETNVGIEPAPLGYTVFKASYDVKTIGVSTPMMSLSLKYSDVESGCSRLKATLMRGGEIALGGEATYDSSIIYSDPNTFQTMCENRDGGDSQSLIRGSSYKFIAKYHIPTSSLPLSRRFDIEGYHYPSVVLQIGQTGRYACVSENFYREDGLVPYVDAVAGESGQLIIRGLGYSNNGEYSGRVTPMARIKGKQYLDVPTGTIYLCDKNEDVSNPWQLLPSPQYPPNSSAYNANPKMSREEWITSYVTMRITTFDDDGWYIGSKKVELADYGLGTPYVVGGTFIPDIFDAIEFKRAKWVTPQPCLMPEVYVKTDGERRFYNAKNYWDKDEESLIVGEADTDVGEVQVQDKVRNPIYKKSESDPDDKHYEFESEYSEESAKEHIETIDSAKPTIEGQTNYVETSIDNETIENWSELYTRYFTKNQDGTFTQATAVFDPSETYYVSLMIDVVEEFSYDATDNDEIWEGNDDGDNGEYKHPYFFAKLRPLGFNLFDLALTEDMVLSMTTGNCGACNFKIGVDENTGKNPVQLWEHDVYKGGDPSTSVLVYKRGELRRYVDLSELYYDSPDGYVPVADGLVSSEEATPLDKYASATPMFASYTYLESDVKNGLVGTVRQNGKKHFEGDVVTSGSFLPSQQDTSENYVWVALMKDTETYGVIMPAARPNYDDQQLDVYIEPKGINYTDRSIGQTSVLTEDEADKFVLLNIRMPQMYLRRAERSLSREIVAYMYDHNYQKFNFSIKFSRIFIEQNAEVGDVLNENSVLYVEFDGKVYRQYVKHYTYKMSSDAPLPEISVDMNEELSVSRTLVQSWDRSIRKESHKTAMQIAVAQQQMTEKAAKKSAAAAAGMGATASSQTSVEERMKVLEWGEF